MNQARAVTAQLLEIISRVPMFMKLVEEEIDKLLEKDNDGD